MDRQILIICLVSGVLSQEDPNIQFLKGFSRLNNALYADYYFSCTGVGSRPQWRINNDIVTLDAIDVGKARLCLSMKIQCIATLLSFTSSNQFYSILMVSANSTITRLSVSCTTDDRTSKIIGPMGNIKNAMLNQVMDSILLQYLFQTNIVSNLTTYFYICGVNDILQAWKTTGVAFGYFSDDMIGSNITKIDNNVAVEAAFLVGFKPYELVSIILVTKQPNVNVTCISRSASLVINSIDIPSGRAPIGTAPTESAAAYDITKTTDNTRSMNDVKDITRSTNDVTDIFISSLNTELIATIITIVVIVTFVLITVIIVIILVINLVSKHQNNSLLSSASSQDQVTLENIAKRSPTLVYRRKFSTPKVSTVHQRQHSVPNVSINSKKNFMRNKTYPLLPEESD